MKHCEIRIKNETLTQLDSYVISRGVPMPPGAIRESGDVSVRASDGRVLPSAGTPLQCRPDGSIEWLLMDMLVDLGGQEKTCLHVAPGAEPQPDVTNAVTVSDDDDTVTLTNGITEVVISRSGGSLVRRLVLNGKLFVDGAQSVDLETVDGGGKIHRAGLSGAYAVTVSHANRLKATVKVEGKHAARDGATFLDFALRFTLTAGCPDLAMEHTFYCREEREGKIPVRAIRLVMPTAMAPSSTKLIRQAHHGQGWIARTVDVAENIEIVSSSVADIDSYAQDQKGPGVSHPCAGGSVFIRDMASLHEDFSEYPFHMRPGQGSGFRADIGVSGLREVHPVLGWKEPGFTAVTAFEHWRQHHPKSISIDENRLVYSIWPEWATPMEIVQGVSKSHIIWLTGEPRELDMPDVEGHLYRWEVGYSDPLDISFDPAWPAYCEALDCHDLLVYQPDKYPLLENLIEPVPSAGNPARHTYDRHPATGMFHFGGAVNQDATSCSNNEDDVRVFFPLQHYLRTGHTYAFDFGKESARHYMEVDFCEWSTDPRQCGGLIPHTGQHFIGNVYASHQWSEGILAYYYLTGDERARNVVISVGDNCCYWAYNVTDRVCCDGREAGMPLVNLAAAYRLTRDEKYVAAAKHIVANFHAKWFNKFGEFKYPYPQSVLDRPPKLISGYGDWSSFAGMYRIWEQTGDEEIKELLLKLLDGAISGDRFSVNDVRGMDFFAAWALGTLTGDMDEAIRRVQRAIPMFLRRGGHPLRRLHFLKVMDERGMINERDVGNRAGSI